VVCRHLPSPTFSFTLLVRATMEMALRLLVHGDLRGLSLASCASEDIHVAVHCPLISMSVERRQLRAATPAAGLELLLPAV
jgi:hypothetical protein